MDMDIGRAGAVYDANSSHLADHSIINLEHLPQDILEILFDHLNRLDIQNLTGVSRALSKQILPAALSKIASVFMEMTNRIFREVFQSSQQKKHGMVSEKIEHFVGNLNFALHLRAVRLGERDLEKKVIKDLVKLDPEKLKEFYFTNKLNEIERSALQYGTKQMLVRSVKEIQIEEISLELKKVYKEITEIKQIAEGLGKIRDRLISSDEIREAFKKFKYDEHKVADLISRSGDYVDVSFVEQILLEATEERLLKLQQQLFSMSPGSERARAVLHILSTDKARDSGYLNIIDDYLKTKNFYLVEATIFSLIAEMSTEKAIGKAFSKVVEKHIEIKNFVRAKECAEQASEMKKAKLFDIIASELINQKQFEQFGALFNKDEREMIYDKWFEELKGLTSQGQHGQAYSQVFNNTRFRDGNSQSKALVKIINTLIKKKDFETARKFAEEIPSKTLKAKALVKITMRQHLVRNG